MTLIGLLACDCAATGRVGRRQVPVGRGPRRAPGHPRPTPRPHRPRRRPAPSDCDRPASWCDAHHIIPYEIGGPSDLARPPLSQAPPQTARQTALGVRHQPAHQTPEFYDPHGNRVLPHHLKTTGPPDEPARPQPGAHPDGRPPDSTDHPTNTSESRDASEHQRAPTRAPARPGRSESQRARHRLRKHQSRAPAHRRERRRGPTHCRLQSITSNPRHTAAEVKAGQPPAALKNIGSALRRAALPVAADPTAAGFSASFSVRVRCGAADGA